MKLRGVCCAEPGEEEAALNQGRFYITGNLRQKHKEPYQCVVEADVSFKASANMVKLDNGYFCRRDGQNILNTWSAHV